MAEGAPGGWLELDRSAAFATFDAQDSGCVSHGIVHDGRRLFVKSATTEAARASLRRAIVFHRAVHHLAIVAPIEVRDDVDGTGPRLVYPWHDGEVLNQATDAGSDRAGLRRFQQLPVEEVTAAIGTILDAHVAVAAAGFVAVDLYDGCFLYDAAAHRMRLIDLDEYRPGPFVVEGDRLPGATSYMAPEELARGATIDERTTVFDLGRTIIHLLDGPDGWRGSAAQLVVALAASRPEPDQRTPTVAALAERWRAVARAAAPSTGGC